MALIREKLRVLSIETKMSKNDVNGKPVPQKNLIVEEIVEDAKGNEVMSSEGERKVVIFADRDLGNNEVIKGSPLFKKVQEGSIIEGSIQSVGISGWFPEFGQGKEIKKFTGIVLTRDNIVALALRNLKGEKGVFVIDPVTEDPIPVPQRKAIDTGAPKGNTPKVEETILVGAGGDASEEDAPF